MGSYNAVLFFANILMVAAFFGFLGNSGSTSSDLGNGSEESRTKTEEKDEIKKAA